MRIELYSNNASGYGTNRYKQATVSNNVSFEGLNLARIVPGRTKAKEAYLDEFAIRYGGYLGIDYKTARETVRGLSDKRLSFFKRVANRYNSQNYYSDNREKEDASIALNLFKSVTEPTKDHFFLIDHVKGSFQNLSEISKYAEDKKNLAFIRKFYDVHRGLPNKEVFIRQMLESKNRQYYMTHIADYKSYVRLYAEDKNAIVKLEDMLNSGSYKASNCDIARTMRRLSHYNIDKSQVITEQALQKNYSPEGLNIINKFFTDYLYHGEKLSEKELNDILEIYKTTNKDNITLRINILDKFKNSADILNNQEVDAKEIKAVRNLFDIVDNNNETKEFVEKAVKYDLNVNNVQELLDVMKVVPAAKANIFYNNLSLILSTFTGRARFNALVNHLEEPFYTNKVIRQRYKADGYLQFYKREGIISKTTRYVGNKINKIKYSLMKDSKEVNSAIEVPESMRSKMPRNKELISSGKVSQTSKAFSPIPQEHSLSIISNEESILAKNLEELTANMQRANERSVNFRQTLKETRQAKRLKVISDINDIINKKLGKKTYSNQNTEYNKKATKIRLSLLPEIFESIKDTRKAQRLAGIRENVSSKDALELYKRINGHNRKLVRYMLSKRNAEGNRIFTIKDIISLIDESEKQIASNKLADKTFKPKSHYDVIYNEYIEKHGKLPARRKK